MLASLTGIAPSWASLTPLAVVAQAGKSEVQKLRDEGNKHFGRKDYQKALEAYDRALKASDKASDKAEAPLLHSNKAACFMMLQRCGPCSHDA